MLKITVIACGNKMPGWVGEAVREYTKRLREFAHVQIIEIPLMKRSGASDIERIMDKEAQQIAHAIPGGARVIALAINGQMFSSETLAARLESLQQTSSHLCFIIGGPEGLATRILARSQELWSLSGLTLPHPLARVVLLEAIYRALAIINHHPYHK
ncbi:23S rRNA (pseudouridine(1915)-N(3))-methyltransferase RlmH [Legionella spiritensis]|uniref:Ribosomal RNA large subunit methyltransferase H n=1 Tax=Legionella spiritensis TaxID=452 RepID=A0A0W0Z5Q5_LEGSP|nr:23S rRNA (pseudouridine(1915)-N(3))-methyltransferase RlmH [Legionella spiritensis]KTD64054.1 rRNA large subunit methyltransferase [Legionella spiritensis]SNV37453.1 rRNA large subunit methyltransferase [Legionella spiritensis]VEG90089.1 rRNA large subunit methyltransferase [Legionella spiritensis]